MFTFIKDTIQFHKNKLDLYKELLTLKKTIFNSDQNIKIYGYDVELYTQDENEDVREDLINIKFYFDCKNGRIDIEELDEEELENFENVSSIIEGRNEDEEESEINFGLLVAFYLLSLENGFTIVNIDEGIDR